MSAKAATSLESVDKSGAQSDAHTVPMPGMQLSFWFSGAFDRKESEHRSWVKQADSQYPPAGETSSRITCTDYCTRFHSEWHCSEPLSSLHQLCLSMGELHPVLASLHSA